MALAKGQTNRTVQEGYQMTIFWKAIIGIVGGIIAVVGIGWLGLQTKPKNFPLPSDQTRDLGRVGLPASLPEPVYRHFNATLGSEVPKIESAVVWGRARIKTGMWMPLRFKAYYVPGQGFYRYMEITWFGLPVVKGVDSYLRGEGVMNIAGNITAGKKIDQGQVLAMWAEAALTPSAYVTDPRIRWEAVDDRTARLVVPFGEGEETLQFRFDPQTGFMSQMSALRYRGQEENKTPWRGDYMDWQAVHSVKIPTRIAVTWEDEGSPWAYWTIDGVEYNVDVSEKIPGAAVASK
jgi:hypothetical protein